MWAACVRIWLYALAFTVLTLLVAAVEPFGVDDAVGRQSRNIIYRAFAPAYDGFGTDARQFDIETDQVWSPRVPGDRPAREQIATVFVSENVIQDIRKTGSTDGWESWRPSYYAHMVLLNDLATLHEGYRERPVGATREGPWVRPPPAIFFDFIFLEQGVGKQGQDEFASFVDRVRAITKRDSWQPGACQDNLDKLVCAKLAGGTPLIFAEGVNAEDAPAQVALRDVAILAPVHYAELGDAYPMTYPLRAVEGETTEATPASLLYLAWCLDNADECKWLEPKTKGSAEERGRHMAATMRDRLKHPMSIVWGSGVPDTFVGLERSLYGRDPLMIRTGLFSDSDVETPSRDVWEKESRPTTWLQCRVDNDGWSVVSLLARKMLGKLVEKEVWQECPYHVEVPYSAIVNGPLAIEAAKGAFDGRVMIVGARFANSADLAISPVHGSVAGFHKHAMAVDNLLTFHNGYLEAPRRVFAFWSKQNFFEAISQFIIIVVGCVGQLWLNKRLIRAASVDSTGKRPSQKIVYATMTLAVILISLGAIYVFVMLLRLEPPNWIGHIVVAVSFFVYLMRDEFFEGLGRWVQKLKGARVLDFIQDWKTYFDPETLGFEKPGGAPDQMKADKQAVVEKLYPPRVRQAGPSGRFFGLGRSSAAESPQEILKEGAGS